MILRVQRFKLILLLLSFVSLFLLSACSVVDGVFGNNNEEQENTIHPVLLNGKWGFINQNGEIVISPQFDEARDASDGFAAVRNGTLWGFVQADPLQVVMTSTFTTLGDFENGLAPAQLSGGQYGYINGTGSFVVDPQFDFAAKFSNGFAAVRTDGLWGYVNESGTTAIEPSFSDAKPFSDGLAAVEGFSGWIYINESGETIIDPSFQVTDAGEFADGLAPIQTVDGWGYIDKNGSPVITPAYESAGNFSEGRAWVSNGGYIGFIDKEGKFLIPPQFNEVKAFSEDMAAVRLNDWFFISKKNGKIVINEPFESAESFRNGIARIQEGEDENTSYGYINKNGDFIWYPTK